MRARIRKSCATKEPIAALCLHRRVLRSWDPHSEVQPASRARQPPNALDVQPPFKHFHFIDLDAAKVSYLRKDIGDRKDVDIYEGDCNSKQQSWVESIRDQCAAAGVAFFFKQWGMFGPKNGCIERLGKKAAGRVLNGRTWDEYPQAI